MVKHAFVHANFYVCPNHMHEAPTHICSIPMDSSDPKYTDAHTYVAVHACTIKNIQLYYVKLYIQKVTMYIETTFTRLVSTVAGKFHYSGKTARGF